MNKATEITPAIKTFFVEDCGVDLSNIGADEDIVRSRVVTSIDLLRLVMFIEERFGVDLDESEIQWDDMLSLNAMAAFVEMRIN